METEIEGSKDALRYAVAPVIEVKQQNYNNDVMAIFELCAHD